MQKRYEPSGFLARQIGVAQGESDGLMTPAASISATRSSSAVPEARGGRRGGCRIGAASAVSEVTKPNVSRRFGDNVLLCDEVCYTVVVVHQET